MKLFSSILLVCLIAVPSAFSQRRTNPNAVDRGASPVAIDYDAVRLTKVVTAVRIHEQITLDGRLDEPAWKLALPATDFVQLYPHTGEISPDRTEVRFLYDDDNLYVGAFMFDSGTPVVTGITYDFESGESDNVNIVIDSLHDRRSGFSFTTNPAGGKRDQQISNDGQANLDWTGVWDVRSSVNGEGWTSEFMIPFKTLRFSQSPSQEWGLNMQRRIMRTNENSVW